MADTGKRRYSKKESLQRIYQVLRGEPWTNPDPENVIGEQLSEDESLSYIAELLAGTLGGAVLHPPESEAHDYGEIFAWTGTSTLTSLSTEPNWAKITGTFQNNGRADGITPSYVTDKLTLTKTGMYFVSWTVTYLGSSAINYKIEPFHGALGTPQAAAKSTPYSSGSYTSMSGSGLFIASGTSEQVDLRLQGSADGWFIPKVATLTVYRLGDYQ